MQPVVPDSRTTPAGRPPAARLQPAPRSRLLDALSAATDANPAGRKWLVGPDVNYGRELLVALARARGGWIGWEAANLRGIAVELAFVSLGDQGVRVASDVEIGALVDRALDEAIAAHEVSGRFAALERGLGFRRAVLDSLLELRTAGTSPAQLRAAAPDGTPAHNLAPVLAIYEHALATSRLADPAAVFATALRAFDTEAPLVLDAAIYVAPTVSARGLPGRLLERLLGRGATVLAGDVAQGLERPRTLVRQLEAAPAQPGSLLAWAGATGVPATLSAITDSAAATADLFSAATPAEELRELLRRASFEGWRWDEIEIVATDTDTYGIALDALCQRLGIGATMLHGVPLERTRLGRALHRWLTWLEDGLPADVLRQALEAGELVVPGGELPPAALGRVLRGLQIGWGRARYDRALMLLDAERQNPTVTPREDESDEDREARAASRRRAVGALHGLLARLLAATPEVPERGSDRVVRTTAAALAGRTLQWLALAAVHGQAEEQTVLRLRTRLEQIAAVADRDASFAGAMAALRDGIADMRSWPLVTSERKPWSSAPGMVHLVDVAHAGTTGRPRIFVVGLDADRTTGEGAPDPLLTDAVRHALGAGALAAPAERRELRAHALATSLATLRGRISLSYAARGSAEEREAGPSPVLLQMLRLLRADASTSYEQLRAHLRPPVSAVPARDEHGTLRGVALLDERDVYLDAIADGPLLLDGVDVVCRAFPMLDAGLGALRQRDGDGATRYHGLVPAAAARLDPTAAGARPMSPTALETLARCPLSWFYKYGLYLRPPLDPEYDPERWLNALQRGSLLHDVYEAFTRKYMGRQAEITSAAAADDMRAIADAAIADWRVRVPPPGEAVFESEAEELRQAALTFLEMERKAARDGDRGEWLELELELGAPDHAAAYMLLDGRRIPIRGRADRIDRLPDGSLRIIDYKTGSPYSYRKEPKAGAFHGGRQLQPAVYAAVVQQQLGSPVSRFEYRFPTERGTNETVAYTDAELREAPPVIERILEHVRQGAFVPTTDANDCAFCDHQSICRATRDEYYKVESPRAKWAGENAGGIELYQPMLANRKKVSR